MAKLTAAERDKLPNSAFAYIDSKGGRHLPLADETHVRDAMSRFSGTSFESDTKKAGARRKVLAAAKRFGIDVAKFSEDESAGEDPTFTGEFAGDPTADGHFVVREAKLFTTGDYPDKAFSLNEAELEAAVDAFRPVPVDLEHIPTVLEGQLGHVENVYASADGRNLLGKVAIPTWLDTALGEGNRKISASWDRATKTLKGLALVRTPRVSDAALMAAFSVAGAATLPEPEFARKRHDTGSGQYSIQRIHDAASSAGAVCGKPADMASRHEATAIQQAHDLAVAHGAKCEAAADGRGYGMFSETKTTPTRSRLMNLREFLTGRAKEEGVEIDSTDLDAVFGASTDVAALKAELAKRDQEIASLKTATEAAGANFASLAAERRRSDAATFSAGQVASFRVTPGAAEKLTALVERVSELDSTATFADGALSTRALLEAFVSSLPDLSVFTTDHIKPETAAALFNTSKTPGVTGKDEPNPAVVERILQSTPDGRAILAERKAGK